MKSLRISCFALLLLAFFSELIGGTAHTFDRIPSLVSTTSKNNNLTNVRQIIRTSTGRLYFFSGNGTHSTVTDGWIDIHTSIDGSSWSKVGSIDQYFAGSDIAVEQSPDL